MLLSLVNCPIVYASLKYIKGHYDLEKSILDKVNVGYEIFRIKTQAARSFDFYARY